MGKMFGGSSPDPAGRVPPEAGELRPDPFDWHGVDLATSTIEYHPAMYEGLVDESADPAHETEALAQLIPPGADGTAERGEDTAVTSWRPGDDDLLRTRRPHRRLLARRTRRARRARRARRGV